MGGWHLWIIQDMSFKNNKNKSFQFEKAQKVQSTMNEKWVRAKHITL